MASEVTIHSHPYAQIAFPPVCCSCLEPATTTHPLVVRLRKVRTGPHTKVSFSYPLQVPYCAIHGREARFFSRYDQVSTIGLCIACALLVGVFDLTVGGTLRATGPIIWWCSIVLVITLLAIGGVALYIGGRKLLQRRYPAIASHYYTGSLGAKAHAHVTKRAPHTSDLELAITLTFHNDDFARQVAALHKTEARPAQNL